MSDSKGQQVALITGGNRGLGFEMCRQLAKAGLQVILAARTIESARSAAEKLEAEGLQVEPLALDVTNEAAIREALDSVSQRHEALQLLINNAGILPDSELSSLEIPMAIVQQVMDTNTLGPWRVTQTFLPLLKKANGAQVVNVSSGLGQLEDMEGGYPAYRVSKAALNAVTRILAAELAPMKIRVNAICPGWVRTDMGGPQASRSPEESVNGLLGWLLSGDNQQTGQLLRDGKPLPW